ncbi:MAG: PQQ-dependent sugar dehydrogenase [Verrucomicrobiota bacterium]
MQSFGRLAAPRRRLPFGYVLLLFSAAGVLGMADLVRQLETSLKMPGRPAAVPTNQYVLVEAFSGLTFDKPVAVASPLGESNRLFVVERAGRIVVLTNLAAPARSIFLDISSSVASNWETGKVEGLSSLAFAPGYLTNRFPFFYATYTFRSNGVGRSDNYNRLARFQSSRATPNEASPQSEVPLITQIDRGEGHNLNDLAFGPDGYLYVAAGDEGDGGKGDDFNNAQHIDRNFFSGILRLDVDNRPENLPPNPHPATVGNYSIPHDNPWVGATNFNGLPLEPATVRTEFYAVGLRNPWRISFDPETGFLYEGDVGQHGREEINVIVRGGNYGWSFREGTLPGPKTLPSSDLLLMDPIYEYSPGYGPNQGFSITGGRVYRGSALPELVGAYLFADYVTGNIWSLRYNGETVTDVQRIAGRVGIAGFGIDPRDGEVLLIDHDRGKLFRLARAEPSEGTLPPTLALTGAFADLQTLTPSAGIVPYAVNVPFWSDGADKRRWFSMPDTNQTITFNPEGRWLFPTGTVWIKHFELTNAVGGSPRRLETRLLVKTEEGIYGVTYRWGGSLADAVLVPEEGMDEAIPVVDQGIIRTQIWHYPGRSECLLCHTPVAGYALGFNPPQLNRDYAYDPAPANQLAALSAAGYFANAISNVHLLPALADLADPTVSRAYRVRSYLAANCVACHQPGGSAYGSWDARISTSWRNAQIINGPLANERGDTNNRVVVPGSLEHSMLFQRVSQLGSDHMPPVATRELNRQAIDLLRGWILNDLPMAPDFSVWQQTFFGDAHSPLATADADPDQDGASNYLEYLTGGDPRDGNDAWQLRIRREGNAVEIGYDQTPNRLFEVQFRNETDPLSSWVPLDAPDNRPFLSSSNRVSVVRDSTTNHVSRLYRVRVSEP